MDAPTLPGLSLEAHSLPKLPSPEALALSLGALGLGAWTVEASPLLHDLRASLRTRTLEVGVRVSMHHRRALGLTLSITGPGFNGCGLGYSPDGRGLIRELPPIPWTSSAAGDILRALERFKLAALVAALETT